MEFVLSTMGMENGFSFLDCLIIDFWAIFRERKIRVEVERSEIFVRCCARDK